MGVGVVVLMVVCIFNESKQSESNGLLFWYCTTCFFSRGLFCAVRLSKQVSLSPSSPSLASPLYQLPDSIMSIEKFALKSHLFGHSGRGKLFLAELQSLISAEHKSARFARPSSVGCL